MTVALPSRVYNEKMTSVHATVIGMCFLMNMCDGLSVMIISYTAPSITKEWQLESGKFGIVFSAGLAGMALGAMFLASFADKIGRKAMIIICAVWMGIGILTTAFVQTLGQLILLRFFSGMGIGSMLACTSALASEYAPQKTKAFWVSVVMAGYPIGAVLCGLLSAFLIPLYGWKITYVLSAMLILITIPFLFFSLKESLEFIYTKQPKNALERSNRILVQMKIQPLEFLPQLEIKKTTSSLPALFEKQKKRDTIILWLAFFLSFTALYFLTSWIPKLATDAGLSLSLAIYGGLVFNLGAFAGIIIQGYLSARFGLRKVICGFLLSTAMVMFLFGLFSGSFWVLVLFGIIGFGIQGGFIGLYAVAAKLYPTALRSTGIGWAIGFGRLGAIIGPLVGGIMIGIGISMQLNFIIFAIPVMIAGIITLLISLKTEQV